MVIRTMMRFSRDSVGGKGGGSDRASFPVYETYLFFLLTAVMILWCVMYTRTLETPAETAVVLAVVVPAYMRPHRAIEDVC